MSRTAKIERKTKETEIRSASTWTAARPRSRPGSASSTTCSTCSPATAAWACSSRRSGDLETGAHHTTEDVGIVLGQAIDEALGDRAGIRRYGSATVPMDEALAECAIDISGRPLTVFEAELPDVDDRRLRRRARRGVLPRRRQQRQADPARLRVRYGSNAHHMIEAAFKAFARALREAVSVDPDETGVPSTKGTLTD